jgi:hypothetical protein
MKSVTAVLIQVEGKIQSSDQCGLSRPRLVMRDPTHASVLSHPLREFLLAGLAEGQPLPAACPSELKPEQATEAEPQSGNFSVAAEVIPHPGPEILPTGSRRHAAWSDPHVEETVSGQARMRRLGEVPPIDACRARHRTWAVENFGCFPELDRIQQLSSVHPGPPVFSGQEG